MKFKNDVEVQNSEIKISSTASAHLILNGDTTNIGDLGEEDAIVDFLHDNGTYGYRLNSENWSAKSAFNIQENINGTYTSRLYIDKDGNVGIGTTSPDYKLDVAGSLRATVESTFTNDLLFPDNSKIKIGSGSDLQIYHNGSNNFIQNSTGTLNIRNTAAEKNITFQADDGAGSYTNYFILNGVNQQTQVYKDFRFQDDVKAKFGSSNDLQIYHDGSDSYIDDTGAGLLRLRGNGGVILSSYSEDETMLQAIRNGAVDLYYNNSKKFETTNTGINVTGEGIFTGNVGIGIDEPTARLNLKSEGTNKYVLRATRSSNSSDLFGFYEDGGGNCELYLRDSASSAKILINGNGDSYFNGGNVGIGTTSPTKNLNLQWNSSSVNPQAGEGLSGGSAGKGVLLNNSNATVGTYANLDFRANNTDARIALTHNSTNNGDFHFILDNTTANPLTRLLIEGQTGNVGIGTDTPDSLLNLEGVKNTSIITLGSTTNNGSWSVGDKIGAINFYSADGSGAGLGVKASISYEVEEGTTGSTNSMVFRAAGTSAGTNNTERMRIESTGITRFSTTPIVLTRNAGDNTTYAASTAFVTAAVGDPAGIVDNSNATVATSQVGWVTVALADTARRAGEIYVTDGESGDHSFIRISWMRSYQDSNFTVLNCGGHQNRIQGVRVLENANDTVYGYKYLQVLVTATSNYYVAISAPGPIPNYSNFTAVTPVLENTKTGYSVTGSQLEDLQNSSVGTDEGITVGEELYVNGTGNSYFTGNVGIGYDNPQSKLQVSSGNTSETTLMVGASGTISDVSSRILLNEGVLGSTNPKTYGFSLAYNGSGLSYGLASNEFAIIRHNNSATGVPVLTMNRANNNAEFAGTVEAINFQLSSDKRLKNNIKEIDTKHIGVNWKNFELKSEPGVKRSGVIAQELEKKHPEFVKTNDKGMKSVAYIDLLIAKIAELEARLEKAGI